MTGTVVLQNNGGDNISTTTNGSFVFSTATSTGASYNVSVLTQPAGQTCLVSSGSGTVTSANITSVSVSCTTNTPVISAIASSTTATTATITWSTTLAADSQVEYGLTSTYTASSTLDSTATTTHSVLLNSLTGLTLYHFRVLSSNGTLATSTDNTFTTTSAGLSTATSVNITGTTTVAQTLTGHYTFNDPNGKTESGSTFQWSRSSSSGGSYSAIPTNSTSTAYVLTAADIGQYLKFQVIPASQSGTGSAALSSATSQINSSGVPTASSVNITGTITEGQTLTGNYTYAQADSVAQGVSTFRWLESATSGGSYSAIGGATASTYALAPSDVGKYIKFEVTPTAVYPPATGTPVQSSNGGPVVASSLPVASAVAISGTQTVGSTLTGSYTYSDTGGHAQATSTFRWLRATSTNGSYVAIGGATALTHTLVTADIGQYLKFEVTPVSTVATGSPVQSNPSSQINSSGVPVASSVNMTGTTTVGQILTGSYSYSQTDGVAEASSTFRWLEATTTGGSYATIGGATNQTYTLTGSDAGKYLKFEVTPIAAYPPVTGAAALSTASAQINGSAVPTASSVTVSGTATVGQTLTGTYTYTQADGIAEGVSTFRWLEATTTGGSYTAIGGATSLTYTLISGDLNQYLKFEVTPVALFAPTTGTAVLSSATGQVQAAAPAPSGGGGGGATYPSILSVTVSTTTATTALILWKTDYSTTGEVDYGTSTAYGLVKTDSTATTTHNIVLSNLISATAYQFKVKATLYGITSTSNNYSFTTLANNAVASTPPQTASSTPVTTTPAPPTVSFQPSVNYPSGTLVIDHGTIYLIIGQTKIGFTSMKVFNGLGYSLKNVIVGDTSGYSPSPITLHSTTQTHPAGSWIIQKKLVYYVSSQGLIPVPSWQIFLNNSGQDKFIVNANKADLKLKKLSVMANNDSRVQ